jgi:signal transduction histidine kinase/CheY-like chemotaxis protein
MKIADRDVDAQLRIQSTILEMIALRGELDETLAKLCELVQELIPSSVASLMLIDRSTGRLMVRSAPGIPKETRRCFDGLAVSPSSGSCGTAAYTGKMVIVENTLTDPRWAGLRDLARKIQKLACWSIPVFDAEKVVGTFAISRSVPGAPSESELAILTTAGHLVGVALARDRADGELREAEAALRRAQKLESLGVLAGGIAHDFNNLLTGILGNAELLGDRAPEGDEALRSGLRRITHAATRAADLTNQMLAYSGRAELDREVVFLPDVVQEVATLLACSISKKAQLSFDIAPDLPNIESDPTQMRQVVMNIITNASEALDAGAGQITVVMRSIDRSDVPASAGLPSDGPHADRYLVLTVRDTGHGMDRTTLSKIFDPFYSTKFAGRGLGLAAVHGIVRGHGGAIDVQSEVGAGTSFTVYIPASDKQLDSFTDTDPVRWTGEATVLVVDDEQLIIELATDVLRGADLNVIEARDGQEAVELYRERFNEIDLVILDLTTPRLSGREVCDRLRAIREDVRIVLSSGYVEADATRDLDRQSLAGFVHKPYTPSDLLRAVRDGLS